MITKYLSLINCRINVYTEKQVSIMMENRYECDQKISILNYLWE